MQLWLFFMELGYLFRITYKYWTGCTKLTTIEDIDSKDVDSKL